MRNQIDGFVHKTKAKRKPRARWSHYHDASEMIGSINHDDIIFGITCGNVSKIDILEHCMNQVEGKVQVLISTWTVAGYDMRKLKEFCNNDKINDIKFIVDQSFAARQPLFCAELQDLFGKDVIRFQKSHAKLFLIIGENKKICCFTSMNLNENKRFENYVVYCDGNIVDKTLDFYNIVFDKSPVDRRNATVKLLDSLGDYSDDQFDFDFDVDLDI